MSDRRPLAEYLALNYPFQAYVDPDDGGYVALFPDLPGCMTQADDLEELAVMAADAKALWMEAVYEDGHDIPLPSYPETHSGKFVARLPKSLHRTLAAQAERDGVSLNQHVVTLLSAGSAAHEIAASVDRLAARLDAMQARSQTVERRTRRDEAPAARIARGSGMTEPWVGVSEPTTFVAPVAGKVVAFDRRAAQSQTLARAAGERSWQAAATETERHIVTEVGVG